MPRILRIYFRLIEIKDCQSKYCMMLRYLLVIRLISNLRFEQWERYYRI